MTRVPPVTALRSPPLSLITGADSPVIADSSTLATPSTTSPSQGMMSPASQTTRSPFLSSRAEILVSLLLVNNLAKSSALVFLSESAWARPRPSARASAKLAKRTVNHNHRQISRLKIEPKIYKVVMIAPTKVRNITGLRISSFGCSFLNASPTALRISLKSVLFFSGFIRTPFRFALRNALQSAPNRVLGRK